MTRDEVHRAYSRIRRKVKQSRPPSREELEIWGLKKPPPKGWPREVDRQYRERMGIRDKYKERHPDVDRRFKERLAQQEDS